MATVEAFTSAVNLIRSMPKEGPFQPSPHLMLKFYSLYKQATEGKCSAPKPAFWAVIEKAKWDAWKALGNMPKEEAMKLYVEELKQIVETMSYSENVANFMHVLGPFYEAVYDGQEPENLRRDSSPQPSSDSGKSDQLEDESGYCSSINGTDCSSLDNNNRPSIEDKEIKSETNVVDGSGAKVSPAASLSSLLTSDKFYSDAESDLDEDEYKDPLPDHYLGSKYRTMNKNGLESSGEQLHVTMAIQRLQADLASINGRLEALERHRKETSPTDRLINRSTVEQIGSFASVYSSIPNVNHLSLPSWFPFKNVNLPTIIVILGWPFVAQYIMARLRRKYGAALL